MSSRDGKLSQAAQSAVLLEDACWCWWTRPRATRVGDTLWFGALDSHGQMYAAAIDLKTRQTGRAILAGFEADDHNNPALVAVPGKPLLAFYARHSEDDLLRYRLSKRPLDLTDWEPERVLHAGGVTSYAEVHPVGDELHVFTRSDETRWAYRHSPDWTKSWDIAHDFLAFDTDQQVYMGTVLLPDGKTLRMAVSGHPKEYETKPLHDIWAALIDLETGIVRDPIGGDAIANLRTGEGLPLDYRDLEMVAKTPAHRTANLIDVGDGPEFEIAWTSKIKDDHSNRDGRYHVSTLRGGKWLIEDVAPTGAKFGYIDAGFYVGGIAFPEDTTGGVAYITREQDGLWTLEKRRRQADGTWSAEALLGPQPTRLTRPWAIVAPGDGPQVAALALERYAEDSYMGTLSHLVTA
jgi:hypothetical protein